MKAVLNKAKDTAKTRFDCPQIIIVVVDIQQKVTRINERFREILGYEENEVIGRHWIDDFIPERKRNEAKATFSKLIAGKTKPVEHFECPVLTKSGEERIIVWQYVPSRDKHGNIQAVFSSGEDITGTKQAESKTSTQQFKALFGFAPDAIFLNDSKGDIVESNKAAQRLLGYDKPESVGQDLAKLRLIPSEQKLKATLNINRNSSEHPIGPDEFVLRRKNGSNVYVEMSLFPAQIKGRSMVLSIARDITSRKQAEEENKHKTEDLNLINSLNNAVNRGSSLDEVLALLSEEIQRVFSCRKTLIYLMDGDKNCLTMQKHLLSPILVENLEELNRAKMPEIRIRLGEENPYYETLQMGKAQLLNDSNTIRALMEELAQDKKPREFMSQLYKFMRVDAIIILPLVSNGEIIALLEISRDKSFEESDLKRLESISEQVTLILKRKEQERQLTELATHDPLTELPNRRALEDRLKRAAARARRGTKSSLLFLDTDNFKVVNDTIGHMAGDQVLIALARLLQKSLRVESFLARLGGDEFAILLEQADINVAQAVAERFRRVVEEHTFNISKHQFKLSISIGITIIEGKQDLWELMSQADTAMYKAKEKGRNQVCTLQTEP